MPKSARVPGGDAERFLSKVPDDYVFRCHDGTVIADMEELKEALYSMSDVTFACHSNPDKKDFSNWVGDIIGDKELAQNLEKELSRTSAAKKVTARVAALSKKK